MHEEPFIQFGGGVIVRPYTDQRRDELARFVVSTFEHVHLGRELGTRVRPKAIEPLRRTPTFPFWFRISQPRVSVMNT